MNIPKDKIKRTKGFTLVELMITILIMTILLLMGTSLTSSWITRSQVNNASSILKTAVFQARVAAIRNTNNKTSTAIATSVCIDYSNKVIHILRIKSGTTCSTSGNEILKSMTFSEGITIKKDTSLVNCFAFSTTGILMSASSCTATLDDIKVKKNDDEIKINIV